MAASQHHQIRRGWEGVGSSQTWEGLIAMLEDLKKLPLDHPDVCRNRTLNRNPSLMAAFLQLRSPTGSLDSFSPEDLMSLQDLPGYGFRLEELRVLPGLDARHSLGSLGEMLEQLSVLPSHHQTDHHKEILRLNPSLKAALINMKGGESDNSASSGSVDGDEVGESRARGLFLATINGAPEYLTKHALSFEMKEEKTPEKMVEYLEVFLGEGVSTGEFPVSLSLMKQLSSINNNMFNAAIIDVLKMFLEQHFDQETIGEFLDLVITELKDAKKNISCLLVEMMTGWVTNAGLFSDLAVQISKPAAALRLLKRSVIRREMEVAAPEGFNLLYQSLKFGLISPQPGLLSSTKEIMLEMILLIKTSPDQLPDLRRSESINEDTPVPLQDPVSTVPRRLITTSMAYSDVQEVSSEEEEKEAEKQEEVRLMLPIDFEVEEGEESEASQVVYGDYDSDASVVVEFE